MHWFGGWKRREGTGWVHNGRLAGWVLGVGFGGSVTLGWAGLYSVHDVIVRWWR